jgi:hypothetical protein
MVRTGRPTDDPKRIRKQFVISEADAEKLSYCSKATGLSEGEIIRQGIDRVYQSLLNGENKAQK